MKKTLLLFTLSLLILTGCTIEKRLYRPGWNVEWKKRYSSSGDHSAKAIPGNEMEKEELAATEPLRSEDTLTLRPDKKPAVTPEPARETIIQEETVLQPASASAPNSTDAPAETSTSEEAGRPVELIEQEVASAPEEVPLRYDMMTIIAIVLTALVVLTFILTITSLFGTLIIPYVGAINAFLLLLAPIFTLVAMQRLKKQEGSYRDFPLWVLLLVNLMILLFYILGFILILLLFSW